MSQSIRRKMRRMHNWLEEGVEGSEMSCASLDLSLSLSLRGLKQQ